MMADIEIDAAYASVVEDEGQLFVGFAAGEEEDEAYVLFRQALTGGPVWCEVTDEAFGAEDALVAVVGGSAGLEISVKPAMAGRFGWAQSVTVRIDANADGRDEAFTALEGMLGAVWRMT